MQTGLVMWIKEQSDEDIALRMVAQRRWVSRSLCPERCRRTRSILWGLSVTHELRHARRGQAV